MQTYIATTLISDLRKVQRPHPETGELVEVEAGYVQPGEMIELEDESAAVLLEQGWITPLPEPIVEEAPKARSKKDKDAAPEPTADA